MPSSQRAIDIKSAVDGIPQASTPDQNEDDVVLLGEFLSAIERCLPALRRLVNSYTPQGSFSLEDDRLTPRQQDVLDLVAVGLTNRAIAHRLGISERTVKNHLYSIFRRLEVGGRTQAALRAIGHDATGGEQPSAAYGRRGTAGTKAR